MMLWLRPYEIIVTSASSGILGESFHHLSISHICFYKEFLPNTYSIDGLKKKVPQFSNLNDFYTDYFGKHFS